MKRRNFIKNSVAGSAGLIFQPTFSSFLSHSEFTAPNKTVVDLNSGTDALAQNFRNPPDAAGPWCFYMWMNGHITKEGITLDLEAMKRMGIGGAICFNSAVGIPRGPIDYAGDEWINSTVHAAKEAERLGIKLSLHNSPGYSGCGGPWVTPEMSMQQLVWTEVLIKNQQVIDIELLKPHGKHDYYRDAFVIAYPSLGVEQVLMRDALHKVWLNNQIIEKQFIVDGNSETKIRLEKEGKLTFEFSEPFEARAITLLRKAEIPKDLYDGPRDHPPLFKLESSEDGQQFTLIGTLNPPELREMDTPATLSFLVVKAKFFRLSVNNPSWVSEVELHNGPRLGGWSGKTGHTHGNSNGEMPGRDEKSSFSTIDPTSVIDISGKMSTGGHLQWTAPKEGNWTILRIGHTTTGEEPAAHPDSGKGLEIDKFRKEALDFHFEHFLDKVLKPLHPYIGKSFIGITSDSWEAGKQNWTTRFPQEFKTKKGYDITPWMPALTGRIVGSVEETERFLWDARKVQADLLSENFYGHYAKMCHQRGLEFHAEPYGDGNFDSLQAGQHLDIPMAEFWTRYIYGSDLYSKQAVSIAHAYGRKIVAAEAFTAMPATAKWTDYPYSLKAEGDYFFSLGLNRLVFHTFVHQPYLTGFPGMTMGPFGAHFDRNNTWTEQACGWTNYLKRAQYLLQQGLTVADICYFKGDNPESGVPDVYKFLPGGYKADVVGADALHHRFSIKNGQITLPDGMSYQLCIMAPLSQILPETLKRLNELVEAGMHLVVSHKPVSFLGLFPTSPLQTLPSIDDFFGNLDGKTVKERTVGKGKISWGKPLAQIFEETKLSVDFEYTAENQDATIHYTHKRLDDAEFYFISNHRRRPEKVCCSFRISGKQPEIWNPENGERYEALVSEQKNGRTTLALELDQAGSLFVVFRHKTTQNGFTGLLKDGQEILSLQSFSLPKYDVYSNVTNSFTINLWAKPDTFSHGNRSMLFHASEGESVYGQGHAVLAASMGQNGVRLYERSKGNAREVLFCQTPIEGWTHLSIVYHDSKPNLYLNGKLAAQGKTSEQIVHPGLQTPAALEQFASYFEGNYTNPELFKKALTETEIYQFFLKGLPAPIHSKGVDYQPGKKFLFWQNGNYSLLSGSSIKPFVHIKDCTTVDLTGEWLVKFPKNSGINTAIRLPQLISLHKYKDFDIQHFSGTAVYRKKFTLSASNLAKGKRLFAHLGRVEVIAEVRLNGQKAGLLWKEPFLVELTKAAKAGENELEVRVTNLWPNRLIGDENLPVENEFTKDNLLTDLPDWFVKNKPKIGKRLTFATWHTYEKDSPLFESGLLGPVKLLVAEEKSI